ncbi:valine--tRNA ligase [Phenylobacterium montanum]|uniref:Valine--tRNA ligase n=1 Tax=Phenylobacterium montanum TaxID=2823693 RepID=A0A975IVB4_9CAUL|nr:valine--tRNA ligase [Caulobacter sp. S6]QUD88605.1 valine--tRNA ligase [Caulobacter sp. S6]
MLEKTFEPQSVEPRLYAQWEASGAFSPTSDPAAEPFSIVIPPPNVTGSLHIGHALNNTLQDVLTRFERMRGKAALWLPGTDHAGIATQMVVERQLAAEGNIGRREMGRETFVDKIWEWKAKSSGTIQNQLRRLGASCDWTRERFTLDEGLSAAVRKVFVQLHKEGLIYRDKRLVNWQPELQTAVSDLEVENIEVNGHMWRFRYPVEAEEGRYVVVATTRPETMLGDTAVAVHPDDERYKDLVGKRVRLPLVGRLIPIVADDYADPEKGTGAVKITPAHDFNDFQVGKRHGLEAINVFTPDAKINENAPEAYQGLDRFVARKRIVADLEALGLLDGIDNHRLMVPYDEKSKLVVIEPYLTDQWYVDAATLAKPAIAAVENGDTVFVPKNWEKTYFEWLRNIEPWCVSRQLWWGHRIPAWYGPDGHIFVEETEAEALAAAKAHYGAAAALTQDEDVLDTWFSSALWPFSTLGWPEETADLKRFYPTHTLVTGFDIIFFWVARMMMMGLHFQKQVPFKRVVINALIRDEKGQKMSKTKGNVIDPLELIDAYGCDAVRFTMAAMSGQARDVRLSRQRVEGYRNFGTKLWNAARFTQMNGCVRVEGFDPATVKDTLNRWIRGQAVKTVGEVTAALEACAFDDAAAAIYRFIWNVFCDWYLELAKPVLNGADEAAKAETRAMTAWVLDLCLVLLHPFSPFITEELWAKLGEVGPPREGLLISQPWPKLPAGWVDAEAAAEIDWVVELVTQVRSVRAEMNVPPAAKPPLTLSGASGQTLARLERHKDLILTLGRLGSAAPAEAAPHGSVPFVIGEATAALSIAEFIDIAAEQARLKKEIASFDGDIERTMKKLGNPDFLARAKEEVIEENRERLAEAQAAKAKLEAALARLATVG